MIAEILDPAAWQAREAAHRDRVAAWTAPRLARQSRHERHPVDDFLWEYYSLRPAQLARWHPGLGTALAGDEAARFLELPGYVRFPQGIAADPAAFPARRAASLSWMAAMLRATAARPGAYGCFGLHEWAMVYRAETVRHAALPLRFPPGEIARIVDGMTVRCTHYDAFRFFTPAARPLNRHQPTRATTLDHEQPGCLHANMDLYKWACKLLPYTPGELVADCFALAREIRELDMRASPYDLTALGLGPVRIETPEGRAEYESLQRGFAARAVPLRARILAVAESLLSLPADRIGPPSAHA